MVKSQRYMTARGSIDPDSTSVGKTFQIRLFKGDFAEGFKITRFVLFQSDPDNTSNDVYGILLTENLYDGTDAVFDASDNRQIGWSGQVAVYNDGTMPGFELLDRDNYVVEDLWIYVRTGTTTSAVNYYIEMERETRGLSQGAVAMVRNSSQGRD